MNKRIKELAQKAGVSFLMEDDHSMVMNGKDLEIFAELIVLEATDIVYGLLDDNTGAEVVVRVKEHFGVE